MVDKKPFLRRTVQGAHLAWEENMLEQVKKLRASIFEQNPLEIARRCGGDFNAGWLQLTYWGKRVSMAWPGWQPTADLPLHDQAMLLYYLSTADGEPMADRWVSYRELPGGAFYHQAFQGYSGDLLARHFAGESAGEANPGPAGFSSACQKTGGWPLSGISQYAFAFDALPRIRLAAVLWPGDEDFPTKAGILFDAASTHYLPIDGLALLGSSLARRILRAA